MTQELEQWAKERGVKLSKVPGLIDPDEIPKPKGSWTINVELGGDFDAEEIWPDRDWPKEPTTADVIEVVRSSGSLSSFLMDWDLVHDFGAIVTVNGEWVDWR